MSSKSLASPRAGETEAWEKRPLRQPGRATKAAQPPLSRLSEPVSRAGCHSADGSAPRPGPGVRPALTLSLSGGTGPRSWA